MPLIPFPDIPAALGVPDLRRTAIGLATRFLPPVLLKFDALGIGMLFGAGGRAPQWIIADERGFPLLIPDTILSVEYRNEAKSGTHPVEAPPGGTGSFAAYNKVNNPFDVSVRFAVTGGDSLTAAVFGSRKDTRRSAIEALEDAVNSTDLFTVVTPDQVFESCSLERFDYRRESAGGVSMLVVDCAFMEIRQTAVARYLDTAAPSAAETRPQGQTAAGPLDNLQNSVVNTLNQQAQSLAGPFLGTVQNMASSGKTLINAALNGLPNSAGQVLGAAQSLLSPSSSAFGAAFSIGNSIVSGGVPAGVTSVVNGAISQGVSAVRSYAAGIL
jgi:hypothetical protein